jgi:glycosyltransferase involved in cell wall biosynthesis
MSEKLFEVFLGTYNAEPWIENVINSLESQTASSFKVNIVDNCSTDKTLEIVKEVISGNNLKNSYSVISNSKNIGAISSFLDQLEIFQSKWILMIHQDDYYHPNHIQTLIDGINSTGDETSVLFTAMNRIDADGNEIFNPPTLAPRISSNRLENFAITFQINPVNFPACALNINYLKQIDTTRHTTAFNDTEMLLRLMCISDIEYIPVETMHYRIFPGNASSITKTRANDRATLIGMNEIIHSKEFSNLAKSLNTEKQLTQLVQAIDQAVDIRIADLQLRQIAKSLLSEALIRIFGYKNEVISNFLQGSLLTDDLKAENQVVRNLLTYSGSSLVEINENSLNGQEKASLDVQFPKPSKNLLVRIIGLLPLKYKEKSIEILIRTPVFRFIKRPFIKVWRS